MPLVSPGYVLKFAVPFLLILIFACSTLFGVTAFAQNPVPFVNQPLVPMTTAPGGPSFTLTVNGTGFVSGASVNWNGTALATTFVNSSQLTAIVPALDIANPTTTSVTVTNPPPGGGMSNVVFFDVANPVASVVFTPLPPNPGFLFVSSIIAADLNRDGKLDLAYLDADSSPMNVIIQLGNSDGSFQAPVSYPVSSSSQVVIVGDFNGDGKADLAVTNTEDNTISILLGNGDGTFQPQSTVPTAPAPQVIVAGDFNGDGKLDLVVGNRFQDTGDVGGVSILLGNGDGTFRSHIDYDTGVGAYSIAMGDFDGNGTLDVVYFPGNQLRLLEGNGDGTFQPPSIIPTSANVESLAAVDLNGDGNLDLIAAASGGGAFVFLGNGNDTFQSPGEYGSGLTSVALTTSDFNADGKLDLELSNQIDNTISVLLGNGNGTLQSPIDFPTAASLQVAVGDFNGDGKMDLALSGGKITPVVFLQGQFPAASISPLSLTFSQQAVGTTSPPQVVTLTNTGTVSLTLSNIGITGANAGDFAETNNCPSTLAVNANCPISVTFTPPVSLIATASLNITDNAPGSPQMVSLTGTTPVFLSPSNVMFPNQYVGTSGLPQNVMLMNTGTSPLTISSVTASPADFAALSACGSSVAPGASCSIGVFFDPTTSGTRNGTLTVTDSASGSPQTASLTGIGQDFSLAAMQSMSTVAPGQTAHYTINVAPAGGFNQTVLLVCSGAPAQSSCSVSPSSVLLNGSAPVPVMVSVTTAGASAGFLEPAGFAPLGYRLALWLSLCGLPGLVLLETLGKLRDRRRPMLVLGFATALLFAIMWSGCGGGSNGSNGTTYNLTVTGTFTSGSAVLQHTVPLTLAVQ